MAGKIKRAISQMVDDLGTTEGVTISEDSTKTNVLCYTRIDMDGDVISYAKGDTSQMIQQLQSQSMDSAVSNRNALAQFLINVTRKI